MPLWSSTSQRLLAAFLVRFAGGGKGAGGDFGGEGSGAGGTGGGGLGRVDGGAERIGMREVREGTAALTA
jgi:hypothetical protein